MFGLSFFEILFLAALALIVIGPKELPVVARTLGRFINELKRSTNTFTEDLKQQARIDRIDLNEAPKKNIPPEPQAVQSLAPQVEPVQTTGTTSEANKPKSGNEQS